MKKVYLIGSLRNPAIPLLAIKLRAAGYEVFDDWFSPGPEADQFWQDYERQRGRNYKEALHGHHATEVFEFDQRHLDACDVGVLVMPAGKSGHLELGYLAGLGRDCYVLFEEEPDRYDIMYNFATDVFFSDEELIEALNAN